MKILIANDGPTAFLYIRTGLARAFATAGHEAILWDIHKKPANDVFDEFEPDLFLGQTYNLTRTLCEAIKARPHMKVIMKAGDWGEVSDGIPKEYGVLKATPDERKQVLDLYEETGKPDYLHIYYHPDYIDGTHGHWIDKGIPVHSHMLAADVFDYTNGQARPEFACDLMFIGGYWPYKAQNIDAFLLPLCENYDYNIKIFGNAHWPVAQYCGFAPNEIVRDLLRSANICLQIHEPHSTTYGFDTSERTFKLLANRCFCISDYVDGLYKIFGDNLIMARTPEEFKEQIDYFLKHPEHTVDYVENGYSIVLNEHTYFHRARDIFQNLGFDKYANDLIHMYYNLRKDIDEGNIVQLVGR